MTVKVNWKSSLFFFVQKIKPERHFNNFAGFWYRIWNLYIKTSSEDLLHAFNLWKLLRPLLSSATKLGVFIY